jgi:hypothetical protein
MKPFKSHDELVKENPGGLDCLPNPHNFSSNPGFMSTAGMLGASQPANGDGVIRGTVARGPLQSPFRAAGGPARAINPINGR